MNPFVGLFDGFDNLVDGLSIIHRILENEFILIWPLSFLVPSLSGKVRSCPQNVYINGIPIKLGLELFGIFHAFTDLFRNL